MKIIVISNNIKSLINFRGDLLKELVKEDFDVLACSPKGSAKDNSIIFEHKLKDIGINHKSFKLQTRSTNIWDNLISLFSLFDIVKNYEPDLILPYTIKPIIFSGLITIYFRLFRKKNIKYLPMITGLGFIFEEYEFSFKSTFFKKTIRLFLSKILLFANGIIFQNEYDKKNLLKKKIIKINTKTIRIYGSGVNLESYKNNALPDEHVFLMASRLIKEKGVIEYINAASIVKKKYPNTKFLLAGSIESKGNYIHEEDLNYWISKNIIKYLGNLQNLENLFKEVRYAVLPTYYNEGMPRFLLEAMSCGKPIISTFNHGCTDIVTNEINGFLTNFKDYYMVAHYMERLINMSQKEIEAISYRNREKAEKLFDVNSINSQIINFIKEIK
tara:strand:- start:137 stop:1294 length:1158 start_codon:yes stop_codon:yes gene_type:complete